VADIPNNQNIATGTAVSDEALDALRREVAELRLRFQQLQAERRAAYRGTAAANRREARPPGDDTRR
jgi:hypothetical protein